MDRGRGRGRGRGGRPTPASNDAPGTPQPQPAPVAGPAQSVLQHDIFASPAPAPLASSGRGVSGSTADFFARASRAPAAGRFRPKNVRRDEASRDILARQEADKEDAKRVAEDRQRTRGRFRSRRSRGSVMGRGRGGAPAQGGITFGSGDWKGKRSAKGIFEQDEDSQGFSRPRINSGSY